MVTKNICILLIISFFLACNNPKSLGRLIIKENAGISRDLEYIKINLINPDNKKLYLKDTSTNSLIQGERLKNIENEVKDSSFYIFPISINANEKKEYLIVNSGKKSSSANLQVHGEGISLKIENEFFIADFNSNESKVKMGLYPGQLAGITIKKRNTLLQRGHINMHWAPNFQKEGLDYKTIGHIDSKNAVISQQNSYLLELTKSGRVTNYEEIDLFGQYDFYAGLPYFEYTSTISFNKDVELILLRNDEMTMDSLFTHLIYPDSTGKTMKMSLYNKVKFDSLTKAPLADDIQWIGFINETLNYGLVSIRLEYNNKNNAGQASPLYRQHTKISESKGNGRYWNRRLIHEKSTLIAKGSKYYEKNIYLIIDDIENMNHQINHYIGSYKYPIAVSFLPE